MLADGLVARVEILSSSSEWKHKRSVEECNCLGKFFGFTTTVDIFLSLTEGERLTQLLWLELGREEQWYCCWPLSAATQLWYWAFLHTKINININIDTMMVQKSFIAQKILGHEIKAVAQQQSIKTDIPCSEVIMLSVTEHCKCSIYSYASSKLLERRTSKGVLPKRRKFT